MTTWAIKDSNGQVLPDFLGSSRIEVGCKVVLARYDAFRLHVSSSYRELFDRALHQVLERHGWEIVQIKRPTPATGAPNAELFKPKEQPARRIQAHRFGNITPTTRGPIDAGRRSSPGIGQP
jgi:hypothetical protein